MVFAPKFFHIHSAEKIGPNTYNWKIEPIPLSIFEHKPGYGKEVFAKFMEDMEDDIEKVRGKQVQKDFGDVQLLVHRASKRRIKKYTFGARS